MQALAPSEVSQSSIDLKRTASALIRRKWLILGFLAVVVASVAVYTMRQPKIYEARTSMIIDVTAPRFLDNQVQDVTDTSMTNYWFNREYYETQHKVITSRAVSRRVVEKLGLNQDPTFLGLTQVTDEKKRQEIMSKMDAVAMLQGRVLVQPVKDSRLVYVTIEDRDPARAALLANEIADAYIEENLSLRMKVTDSASRWLEDRRETLDKKSKESELKVYDFQENQDMLSTSLGDRQGMVSQRLNALNGALTEVRMAIAGTKARVDAIRTVQKTANDETGRWAEGLPAAAQNEVVMAFKMRYANQRTECAELGERYLSEHPKLQACREKLESTRTDLIRELNNIVVAAEAELRETQAKEKNLVDLFEAAKTEAFEVNKKQIEYDHLKRESDNDQRLNDLVLKRLKDLELSGMLRTNNVRVLDAALPGGGPIRPNLPNAVAMAAVFGLLGGIALALMLDRLDTSITSQQEIEDRLGLPFLGLIPQVPESVAPEFRDTYIHTEPKSSMAECCRAIRTNLLFMSPDEPFKALVVTSSGPQEGKTTTVISLGIAMANSGKRVLLMDTDMRRPRLHRAFGISNDRGVSSLVVGEGELDAAVHDTQVPNLFILPCGPIPPNPAELLHTVAFRNLLDKLLQKFDQVILDSPPIGAVADAVVLATQASGVVVVVKAGATKRETARAAFRSLKDVNAKIFGAVLNNVSLTDARYGNLYYAYARYGYDSERMDEAA